VFDVCGGGFVWVVLWVGLCHGFISSPGSGLGWAGSVVLWVRLGLVDENRPTDNHEGVKIKNQVSSCNMIR